MQCLEETVQGLQDKGQEPAVEWAVAEWAQAVEVEQAVVWAAEKAAAVAEVAKVDLPQVPEGAVFAPAAARLPHIRWVCHALR